MTEWSLPLPERRRLRVTLGYLFFSAWFAGVLLFALMMLLEPAVLHSFSLFHYLKGETLYFENEHIDLGPVQSGQTYTLRWTVRNLRSTPIQIIGQTVYLDCRLSESIPIQLGPGESKTIQMLFEPTTNLKERNHCRYIEWFVDQPGVTSTTTYCFHYSKKARDQSTLPHSFALGMRGD